MPKIRAAVRAFQTVFHFSFLRLPYSRTPAAIEPVPTACRVCTFTLSLSFPEHPSSAMLGLSGELQ